jgi:hypothetical protein
MNLPVVSEAILASSSRRREALAPFSELGISKSHMEEMMLLTPSRWEGRSGGLSFSSSFGLGL